MSKDRLLIVDDEPDICDLLAEVAAEYGFDATVAHDGRTFRELYQRVKPTVIVLDLKLPEEDGVELLRFLAEQRSQARIVLMSGVDAKVLNTAAYLGKREQLQIVATLPKPISLADLEAVFEKALGSSAAIEEKDLASAIESDQLVVHYQPKVNLKPSERPSLDIIGVEALVRWIHPELGLVAPNQFVPLAEKSGLIGQLTQRVLEKAIAQVQDWNKLGIATSVAVNFSAYLIDDLAIPHRLAELLKSQKVPPSQLMLEITESGVMANPDKALEILTRLRLKGVSLSIDDFGTGFSSLEQLHRLPFSELKIDRSFVGEMDGGRDARSIVESLIDLAHKLGMVACAEGVETPSVLRRLCLMGCDTAQGYMFSAAVDSATMTALLLNGLDRAKTGIDVTKMRIVSTR